MIAGPSRRNVSSAIKRSAKARLKSSSLGCSFVIVWRATDFKIIVERNRGRADVGTLFQIHPGARSAGVGKRIDIIIGGCRIRIGENLLVLEPAQEVGKWSKRQPELGRDPPARRHADIEQELEDQALDDRRVEPGFVEALDGSRVKCAPAS